MLSIFYNVSIHAYLNLFLLIIYYKKRIDMWLIEQNCCFFNLGILTFSLVNRYFSGWEIKVFVFIFEYRWIWIFLQEVQIYLAAEEAWIHKNVSWTRWKKWLNLPHLWIRVLSPAPHLFFKCKRKNNRIKQGRSGHRTTALLNWTQAVF